jgi:hypothetical protein
MDTKYNFYRRGDTWDGRSLTFPFSLVGCQIIAQFKTNSSSEVVFEYNTLYNTFIINGSVLTFKSRRLLYPSGIYNYDIQITFPDGRVKTYGTDKLMIFDDISQ